VVLLKLSFEIVGADWGDMVVVAYPHVLFAKPNGSCSAGTGAGHLVQYVAARLEQ
jgi:acetamidase/formamidase